jgi:glycosyltransferase involved in cell wall biosynthesis
MGYGPNVDAAKLLVEWTEELKFEGKPISILIAGARPDSQVLRLAGRRVDVRGWVDDIRDAYNAGTIFAAPIFTGSGLQNKILEAMAMGIPCISTSMVNQSILAPEGEVIRIADTREAFCKAILTLLANGRLRNEMADSGREYVANNFSWERFNTRLNDLLMKPVPKHGYSTFKGRNE